MPERHPDVGRVRALVDGELEGEVRRELLEHLRDCSRCRDRVRAARRREDVFTAAAEELDRPVPDIPNPSRSARDTAGSRSPAGGRAAWGSYHRAAALVAAVLLGGALLTPPGRALASRALEGIASLVGGTPDRRPAAAASAPDTAADDRISAASAMARNGRVAVEIATADATPGTLRVRLAPGRAAVVEGRLRDVERSPGRLRVAVRSLSDLSVQLPGDAPDAEVSVDGRTVVRRAGGELRPSVPADSADGTLFLRVGRR